MTQLWGVTCHMGSHSVTCYLTQVNTPRLHPSQTGWYSIYRPFNGGGLSKPRPRVQRATGPLLLRDSPEPARPEPRTQRSLVQHANHQAITSWLRGAASSHQQLICNNSCEFSFEIFRYNCFVIMQTVVPLLEGLEVDNSTFRLGLSQVITVIDQSSHTVLSRLNQLRPVHTRLLF